MLLQTQSISYARNLVNVYSTWDMYITLKGWRISNNGCLSKGIEGKRFRLIMIVLQSSAFSTMHFDFINFLADF